MVVYEAYVMAADCIRLWEAAEVDVARDEP